MLNSIQQFKIQAHRLDRSRSAQEINKHVSDGINTPARDFSDRKTPYERRFGKPFNGPIPFGAMVEYHPIYAKDHSRLHQFGKKVLPGIFLGYALFSESLKGDILVADFDELENLDASENHRRHAKEVSSKKGEPFLYSRSQMVQ